ncbi:MAG TPA: hypothetical protein VHN20_14855, partial [Beijerinckiaceae bacterium]|nr:hypothetical protein [Beijerinckiaceae bacterium]
MPAIVVNGTAGNDTLVVTATSFDSGFYQLNSDPVQGFSGATGFTFNALAGNDVFTITNPVGTLFNAGGVGIFYNAGGDPTDAFNNLGGVATFGSYDPNAGFQLTHLGAVVQAVQFTGLLPTGLITDTVSDSNSFTIFGTPGADTLTVTDGGVVDGGATTQVNSNTAADIRVSNKPLLIINGNGGGDTINFNNPTPAAGLTEVDVLGVGAVTQSGAVNYQNLSLNVSGPVTLNGANDVDNIAAVVTGAGNAFAFNDVDDITITSVGGLAGITTTNGNITVTTDNGVINVNSVAVPFEIDAGSASVTLRAGSTGVADNAIVLASGADVRGTGGVTLTADNIQFNIANSVNAGTATATLQPFQDGTLIDVGGPDAPNTLGVSDLELDQITAGTIVIGNTKAGNLTVTAPISPAGSNTLILKSGGTVTDAVAGALLLSNVGAQGLSGVVIDNPANTFTNFEAEATTGGITLVHFGALTIGDVTNDLRGLFVTTSGNIDVLNTGSITLTDINGAESVHGGSTSGDVILTAVGALADITSTVNRDAINAPAGNIVLTAGQDVKFGTAGLDFDNDVRASGNITFVAGRDIVVDGFSDVASDDQGKDTGGSVFLTAGRDVNITDINGVDASVSAEGKGGGDVTITAGADRFLNLTANSSQAVFSRSGDVTVNADRVVIASDSGITTNNGSVNLLPVSAAWTIDLGSAGDGAANTLELSDAELDRIFTQTLRIGNLGNTGPINVTSQITGTTYPTLSLSTAGGVVDATGGEQTDLTVTRLAVRSGNGIGSANDLDTAVSFLAFQNTGGAVNISNTGALTIDTVDGL